MNETAPDHHPEPSNADVRGLGFLPQQVPLRDRVWFVKRVGVVVLLFLLILGGPAEQLLLGWVYFPARVIPRMVPDWPSLILGLLATVGFLIGIHRLIQCMTWETMGGRASISAWHPRTTLAIFSLVVLMFVAGTAMVGATHQALWLLSGKGSPAEDSEAKSQRWIFGFLDLISDVRQRDHRTSFEKGPMRSITYGVLNTHDSRKAFPAGGFMTEDGVGLHGWAIQLEGDYYAPDYDFSRPWNEPPNDRICKSGMWWFINPSIPPPYFDEQGFGLSHVAGNVHVLPILTVPKPTTDEKTLPWAWITQGQREHLLVNDEQIKKERSNTILLGTVSQNFKPWGHPANVRDPTDGINAHPNGFGGPPIWKGAMFGMADGSVRMLSDKTDPEVLRAMSGSRDRRDSP